MLGKLSVPGRPTSLDDSRARAYCSMIAGQGPIAVGADGVFLDIFSHLSFLSSLHVHTGDTVCCALLRN